MPGRIGRPRNVEQTTDLAPVEQILAEAGRLFTQQGYQATTTREIAEAVGLRQGSLYHYFQRKEDILAELLERIIGRAVELAAWIDAQDASAAAKVWTLGFLDVANYLFDALRIGVLVRLPEVQQPRFRDFWSKAHELQQSYETMLAQGRDEGTFTFDDLGVTGLLLFGIADGPAYWYDPALHDRLEVARLTARSILLTVLVDPTDLPGIVTEGLELARRAPTRSRAALEPGDPA